MHEAECLFDRVNVILQPPPGGERAHFPVVRNSAVRPVQCCDKQFQVATVRFADPGIADSQCACVVYPFVAVGAVWIVVIGNGARYKGSIVRRGTVVIDLIPIIKPHGFHFFLKDLSRAKTFAAGSDHGKALGDAHMQYGEHEADDGQGRHLLRQRKGGPVK